MRPRYYYRNGYIDYNDLATQTTPLSYTSGELKIWNDGAGPYSTSVYKPVGVTRLFNTATGQFDFSQLAVGDQVTIRTDWTVTTTTNNQIYGTKLRFDIGGTPFELKVGNTYRKAIGTYPTIRQISFYIWSTSMKNNPAELIFESDAPASIKVNWFYISVERR